MAVGHALHTPLQCNECNVPATSCSLVFGNITLCWRSNVKLV